MAALHFAAIVARDKTLARHDVLLQRSAKDFRLLRRDSLVGVRSAKLGADLEIDDRRRWRRGSPQGLLWGGTYFGRIVEGIWRRSIKCAATAQHVGTTVAQENMSRFATDMSFRHRLPLIRSDWEELAPAGCAEGIFCCTQFGTHGAAAYPSVSATAFGTDPLIAETGHKTAILHKFIAYFVRLAMSFPNLHRDIGKESPRKLPAKL